MISYKEIPYAYTLCRAFVRMPNALFSETYCRSVTVYGTDRVNYDMGYIVSHTYVAEIGSWKHLWDAAYYYNASKVL